MEKHKALKHKGKEPATKVGAKSKKVDENPETNVLSKRKKEEGSPETSLEIPPRKKIIIDRKKINEVNQSEPSKENEDDEMETDEMETVILPRKIVDDLKERLEKVEQDNKQLDAKVKQWEANSITMKDKITTVENENKDKTEEIVKLTECLNTPIVGVAKTMMGSEPEQKYSCLLCHEKNMNKTNLHIHLQQMHNVNRQFAEIMRE